MTCPAALQASRRGQLGRRKVEDRKLRGPRGGSTSPSRAAEAVAGDDFKGSYPGDGHFGGDGSPHRGKAGVPTLPTTYYLLPTYVLPTTYYILPNYLIPTTYHLPPTPYSLLPTTHHPLITTTKHSLLTPHRLLRAAQSQGAFPSYHP